MVLKKIERYLSERVRSGPERPSREGKAKMFTRINANANTSVKNTMHACVLEVVVQNAECKAHFTSLRLCFVLAIFARETNANASHAQRSAKKWTFFVSALAFCASLHMRLVVFTFLVGFALHVWTSCNCWETKISSCLIDQTVFHKKNNRIVSDFSF